MSTIDEIMAQADRYALRNAQYCAAHITNTDLVSGEVAALRHLITQAIAEARADGAREMREPVRLTDDEIVAPVVDGFGATTHDWASHIEFARAIETAVLAANGLGVRRG